MNCNRTAPCERKLMTGYAFPGDLVSEIKAHWSANLAGEAFRLPDDFTLQHFLEICYHASLRTEEQRPVRCVVAYAPVTYAPRERLLLFEHSVELTDAQIVRLAPVADLRRTLIGCDHIDGQLCIWGLMEHGYAWAQYAAGDPQDAPFEETDLPPGCLAITLEGPGTLSVAQGRHGLVRLREGRIIVPHKNPMRDVNEPLGLFFHHLVEGLRNLPAFGDRLFLVADNGERPLLGIYTRSIAAILEHIRLRREGGSLVIARTPLESAIAQITYTVAEHWGLTGQIVNYYETLHHLMQAPHTSSETPQDLARCRAEATLRFMSQQLLRGINQISLLASVDGAVLLDDLLRIQGFGVRFSVLLPLGATIVDAATGTEHACDQWGLRHQSVFSACQRCEDAVGLVVSHDGGVKAVKSIGGKLHLWDQILD